MQLHQLQPIHKPKKGKRIGRGGKKGTYSGRGIKGQSSRAGARLKPFIREIIKRYPKLRGYRTHVATSKLRIVNLGSIEKKFNAKDTVTPTALLEKKMIRNIMGQVPDIKILAQGELTKALTFQQCMVSEAARKKIEKAGGTIA